MAAFETLDVQMARGFFCARHAQGMAEAWDASFVQVEEVGIDPQDLLDAFSFNFGELSYEETMRDESTARVRIYGPMWMEVDGEKLASFLKNAAIAQGRPVNEEEVSVLVALFSAMAGQETPVESDVQLVKEGGKWLVCDTLGFLNEFGNLELSLQP